MDEDRRASQRIRVGPAGWSSPDWAGQVSPQPRPRGCDPLRYLAGYFDALEINATCSRIPDAKAAQGWAVLRQFPSRAPHTAANRATVRRLADAFREYPLVLEVRHRSRARAEVFAWLQALGLGCCHSDQPQVSSGLGLTHGATSPVGDLRLPGRQTAMWCAADASGAARDDCRDAAAELRELVGAGAVLSRRARDTALITNNHCRGQAALHALERRHRRRRAPVPVPPPRLAAYPELRQVAAPASEADA